MKTKENIEVLIIERYFKDNVKIKDLSKEFNISRQTIRKIILRNNYELKAKKVNDDVIKKILLEYSKGKTTMFLSEKYSLHRTTIQRIVKNSNINLRLQEDTSRKYDIINFKTGINNSKDAYLLGLIYSDGNLSRNCVEISLHEKDKQILNDISEYVYGRKILGYRKSQELQCGDKTYICAGQFRFRISSKSVCSWLRNIGLCENKSLKITFPILEEKYISHFIRGYFDGDGCLFQSKKYKHSNRITIVSNYKFLEELKENVNKRLPINSYVYRKNNNVGSLIISGNNQIKLFLDWLYEEADLKLNRKYKIYEKNYK